jgi:hypothetical protein
MNLVDYLGIDAILVLGGEPLDTRPRSNGALKLYYDIECTRTKPLHIITSGRCSGLSKNKPTCEEETEAYQMKEYILTHGEPNNLVPDHLVHAETESLDTLANFVYSREYLNLFAEKPSKNLDIAIIVDEAGVERTMRIGRKVLGPKYNLLCYPIKESSPTLFSRTVEKAVIAANGIDLLGIKPGDQRAYLDYLNNKHPFHSESYRKYLTAYGLGVLGMKTLMTISGFKPRQVQE